MREVMGGMMNRVMIFPAERSSRPFASRE